MNNDSIPSADAGAAMSGTHDPHRAYGTLYLLPAPLKPQSDKGWSDQDIAAEIPGAALARMRLLSDFAVESERSARRLLARVIGSEALAAASLTVLDEHSGTDIVESLMEVLRAGRDLGILSEAGIPCVADPGAALVLRAHKEGIAVRPLSGPSSLLLALAASGLDGQRFMFLGYLPAETAARAAALAAEARAFARDGITRMFIETPYRNDAMLSACLADLPGHLLLCVASDLAGPAERIATMSVAGWKKEQARSDSSGSAPAPLVGKVPAVFLFGKRAELRAAEPRHFETRRARTKPGR